MKSITRRDFLKLGGGALTSVLFHKPAAALMHHAGKGKGDSPNIVLLICDAMAARNLSLYGYPRNTAPNLEQIAQQAFVYHNHYSDGNFTTPGTASLLTGLRPWTHRAIQLGGIIKNKLVRHNLFHFLGDDYFKLAFTQNFYANYLLDQFAPAVNTLLPYSEFGLVKEYINNQKFRNDSVVAYRAIDRTLYNDGSLLLDFIMELYPPPKIDPKVVEDHPAGFPSLGYSEFVFTLNDLFTGIADKIAELDSLKTPFFSYFHVYPPHHLYCPQKDFYGMFKKDGYRPTEKGAHALSAGISQSRLNNERRQYDSYVANVDMEIGRLVATLKKQGILDRTYFIISSDHGEMFERGVYGHLTPLLYESVIKIPLLILVPNNQTRRDFTINTSSIDVAPTLLKIAGQKIPDSIEGKVLPGFGGDETNRTSISMEAISSPAHKPFTKATYAIINGRWKLHYYYGYPNQYREHFEFYDLDTDPEELRDRYSDPKLADITSSMKRELFKAMDEANKKL